MVPGLMESIPHQVHKRAGFRKVGVRSQVLIFDNALNSKETVVSF